LAGLWSVPFVIIFSVTGIWYFAERTDIANISETANFSPPKIELSSNDSTKLAGMSSYNIDFNKAESKAKDAIAGLEVKDIFSSLSNGYLSVTGRTDVPLVRNRANTVYLDLVNYEILKVREANEISTITWLNDIADPLHFGYWGGLTTKIIWFLSGLAISGLVLTGIWISQKNKYKNRKLWDLKNMGIWKYVNWLIFGVMIGFMYYFLIVRYDASLTTLLLAGATWFLFIGIWYYLFDYRIRKSVNLK
jgi:uncharacterized iron-regulated membrane protein